MKLFKQPDWVVVGAGFSGAVLARRIADNKGQTVLIIERRGHVGGNAYDPIDKNGIRIHQYGPHIFHTNSEKIFKFLSNYTAWHEYEHKVLGEIHGKLLPIPFNFTTLSALDKRLFEKSHSSLLASFGVDSHVTVQELRNSKEKIFREVGELAYETIFKEYTKKQWGLELESLSPTVGARVPIRLNYDDRYFTDKFQFMPADGYEALFKNLLDHPSIKIELNIDFNVEIHRGKIGTVYTGALDELLAYELGELPYRSLEFVFESHTAEKFQSVGQVNYPLTNKFTRISEFKHMTLQTAPTTVIAKEYPIPHKPGINIPYYPVPQADNQRLHKRYEQLLTSKFNHIVALGRLADYKYYNMDQAVARALQVADSI